MPFTVTNIEQQSEGSLRSVTATLTFGKTANESLADPGLSSTTKWAGATDWSDTIAGSTSYLHSGGTGTLTQTAANQAISGVASRRYRFTFTISSINIAGALTLGISTAYGGSFVELPIAATGTFSTEFTTDEGAATADFVLSATSTTTLDAFTLTNFSLKQLVEYPSGGESLTPSEVGLGQFVGDVQLNQGDSGFTYQWDSANQKIIVMAANDIPQLIVDEVVVMTTDAGTLAYPPAYICAIVEDDKADPATLSQVYDIVPIAETPVNNVSVAVNFVTGAVTNAGADGPPALRITYFPQRPGTFFSKENLVIDEVVRADTTAVNLDFAAAAIQYVYGTTDTIQCAYDTPGDSPDAGSVVVDIDDDNGGTTLLFNAAEANVGTEVMAVTYLKQAGLGNSVTLLNDSDRALSSEAMIWTSTTTQGGPFADNALGVPGLGVKFIGEETSGDTQNRSTITNHADGDSDNVSTWNPRTNTLQANGDTAVTSSNIHWLKVYPDAGIGGVSEIAANTDLSAVSITIYARGR